MESNPQIYIQRKKEIASYLERAAVLSEHGAFEKFPEPMRYAIDSLNQISNQYEKHARLLSSPTVREVIRDRRSLMSTQVVNYFEKKADRAYKYFYNFAVNVLGIKDEDKAREIAHRPELYVFDSIILMERTLGVPAPVVVGGN
ncbi:MAG: hypothetical protein Q7S74_05725 [Nanoarchaeota archaeon]|nr:hypothetical protein [Nanoarchaeota archaeon]